MLLSEYKNTFIVYQTKIVDTNSCEKLEVTYQFKWIHYLLFIRVVSEDKSSEQRQRKFLFDVSAYRNPNLSSNVDSYSTNMFVVILNIIEKYEPISRFILMLRLIHSTIPWFNQNKEFESAISLKLKWNFAKIHFQSMFTIFKMAA